MLGDAPFASATIGCVDEAVRTMVGAASAATTHLADAFAAVRASDTVHTVGTFDVAVRLFSVARA